MLTYADVCRQYVVKLPGDWHCRRTLMHVLSVFWLDVFEAAGWYSVYLLY